MNSISPKLLSVTLTSNKTLNSSSTVRGNPFRWNEIMLLVTHKFSQE
jgi:hypothetical protein